MLHLPELTPNQPRYTWQFLALAQAVIPYLAWNAAQADRAEKGDPLACLAQEFRKRLATDPEEMGPPVEDSFADWRVSVAAYQVDPQSVPASADPTWDTENFRVVLFVAQIAVTDQYAREIGKDIEEVRERMCSTIDGILSDAVLAIVPGLPAEEVDTTVTLHHVLNATSPTGPTTSG